MTCEHRSDEGSTTQSEMIPTHEKNTLDECPRDGHMRDRLTLSLL